MRKKATAGLLTGALALAVLAASATAAPVVSRVTIHRDPAFHGRGSRTSRTTLSQARADAGVLG